MIKHGTLKINTWTLLYFCPETIHSTDFFLFKTIVSILKKDFKAVLEEDTCFPVFFNFSHIHINRQKPKWGVIYFILQLQGDANMFVHFQT